MSRAKPAKIIPPGRAADARGVGRLAIDATLGLTDLVENLHHNILRTPGVFGTTTRQPTQGITGFVYKSIRGVTRLVGSGIDVLLGQLAPLLGTGSPSAQREVVLAALNGVLGDTLALSANPLAISMCLRRNGKALSLTRSGLDAAIPQASGKIMLLVHGLCMSDLQWLRNGHDHGAALSESAGYTPVYLHYNSGLHISTNGHELSALLDELIASWPVAVDELMIVGHSMGGLVARSACHDAQQTGRQWLRHVRKILFLGTPHHGAPLERGGNWIDVTLQSSPYTAAFARLGKIRSAGITDLRHGSVLDTDWQNRDRFERQAVVPSTLALPASVKGYAIAACIAKKPARFVEQTLGDGLVKVSSALAQTADQGGGLKFSSTRQWTGYGMNHLDLLDNREVYERMLRWLHPDVSAPLRA